MRKNLFFTSLFFIGFVLTALAQSKHDQKVEMLKKLAAEKNGNVSVEGKKLSAAIGDDKTFNEQLLVEKLKKNKKLSDQEIKNIVKRERRNFYEHKNGNFKVIKPNSSDNTLGVCDN